MKYSKGKIRIPVKRIKWELEGGKYTPRVPSPADVEVLSPKVEYLELVPYGVTELRLTVFPVIKNKLKSIDK